MQIEYDKEVNIRTLGHLIKDGMIVDIANDTFVNFIQQYADPVFPDYFNGLNETFNLEISKYKENCFQVKFISK